MSLPVLDSLLSTGTQSSATSPLTYSFTNSNGTLLVVGVNVTGGGTAAITGVTYAGTNLTRAATQSWGGAASVAEIWFLVNPAKNANNVVVTATGISNIFSYALSFTGADPAKPIRQTGANTQTGVAAGSVTLANVLTGSIVFAHAGAGAGGGFTGWGGTDLGILNVDGSTTGNNSLSIYAVGADLQSQVMNFTLAASDQYGEVAVEIQGTAELSESVTPDVLYDAYGPIRIKPNTAFQSDAFQQDAFQEFGGVVAAGGGTLYTGSVSEQALAQDTLVAAQGFATSLSEQALAQDVLATAQGEAASLIEQALAQDALATAQGQLASLSEQALAQDSELAGQGTAQGLLETATPGEQTGNAQGQGSNASEKALAQDVLLGGQGFVSALSEVAQGQDSVLPAAGFAALLAEASPADVLYDSTLLHPGSGGSQYDESIVEACAAQEALAAALGSGSGTEAKIGGANAAVSSVFIFDD